MIATKPTVSFSKENDLYVGTIWCHTPALSGMFGERNGPALSTTIKDGVSERVWSIIYTTTGAPVIWTREAAPSHLVFMDIDQLAGYTEEEVLAVWSHEIGHILNGDTLSSFGGVHNMTFQTMLQKEINADRRAVKATGRRVVAKALWKTANLLFSDEGIPSESRFNMARAYRGRMRALFSD